MKKYRAILLTAALLLCAAPLAGFAAIDWPEWDFSGLFPSAKAAEIVDSGTCGEVNEEKGLDGSNLTWTLDSDGLLTISGSGPMRNYDRNGSLWYQKASVKKVILQNGVTSVGNYAFEDCEELTSVTIPDSAISIGEGAFYGCTGLMSVAIPDSVTSIGDGAFDGCRGLMSVTIPNSVTNIGDGVFDGCRGMTSVTIPDSVKSIGKRTFHDCRGLMSVTIPDSVTNIGNWAFGGCTGLTSVTIPDSVTSIGGYAFYECTSLTSAQIPNSVTSIGECAFTRCAGLMSVTIPGGVTSIHYMTFENCTGLTSVTIPDSVTSIWDHAFSGCAGLTSIILPQSVTEIGYNAIPEQAVIYGYIGSYAQQWAEENNRAFVPMGDAAVTLNAPEVVNEPSVNVYGFANPGAEVVCSVNGNEAVTVQAAANGRWSAAIPLTGAKDGDSFAIKASVTAEDKTAEKTATVTYKPDAIVMQEFTLNHSCYTVTVKGERLGVSVPNFTFVPGNPLAFKIKMTNNERVGKLYVVSTKDGDSKPMELTYDADSGYWFANGYFDNADKNYVPGVFTVRGVDKDGKAFDCGVTIKINFLIDPSGYAYEAVTSNKLEGVTAAVYYKDAQGHELLWNAETADQLNPVTTLSDGAFAWVVPEGQWQVRLTKPGYLEARSQWMDVPPEYTDVYLGMAAEAAPEVAYCNVYADRAEITFSQYMDLNTVNTDNVKFDGYTGAIVPLDAVEESEGSGNRYAKTFAFTPEKSFAGEIGVVIENVANYVGTPLASPYTATFTVAAEPKNLTATQDVSVVYGKTADVTVSAENAAGKTVSVSCDSANVTLSDKTLTLDETGKATLSVTGEMPGVAHLTFTLDGTTLTAAAKVSVTVPGVPTEPEQPTDPENPATPTDPENPTTPTDPETPATPTDPENPTTPTDPENPATPTDPESPATPTDPENPATPTAPENPATPTDPEGPDQPTYALGDVDGDGEVTSGDARLALRASVQLEKYEPGTAAFLAADADKNGEIESSDARTILRVSVKLETF